MTEERPTNPSESIPPNLPVELARDLLPTDAAGKLVVSICIDVIGSSSYLLPGIGESFDLAWAPIQTILIMAMYDDAMPSLKYISFFEEILPFTDLFPTAMTGWIRQYVPGILQEGAKRVREYKKKEQKRKD